MAIIKSKRNLPGVSVSHLKNTSEFETVDFDIPKSITVPMIQHMGAPCEPIVAKGDMVFVGTKIGEGTSPMSVPIHASCSGVVTDIISHHTVNGVSCKSVVIETDSLQTIDKNIKKPIINTREEFIAAIRESGLVGLGGAGFPTYLKLSYKNKDSVKKLVINAAECEPYITADYREALENTQNIANGIRALKKYLGIDEIFFGIEDNKPKAITVLNDAFKPEENVKIVQLKSLYPQGAEKSIIYAVTKITVPQGKLPSDCGVLVMNISTVGFIGGYLENGIPLVKKRITVDGDFVNHKKNLFVPIGTKIGDILDSCQIDHEECSKVLMGGPMMGIPIMDFNVSLIKNNNAIIALSHKACEPMITTSCIRCGKCIRICPMQLMPANLEKAYDARDVDKLNELDVSLCINCGCCTFICPAKRHLAQKNQLSKMIVRNAGKKA